MLEVPHSRPPSTRADTQTVDIVTRPMVAFELNEPSPVFNHALHHTVVQGLEDLDPEAAQHVSHANAVAGARSGSLSKQHSAVSAA